ncbi:hypothetical protein VFPPC_18091 [Pochonia chlamydosporia 170]|uniref:Uncharacterized protein n=1 Tax=Pochonia chlamydosporia 170 TaxID=1380566 RepID=A0A219APC1_METCM|nr:hypothetical protein VFPPC_18091 [Pochonia chlamydosporia 170]OWT42678.1 hypothetical protein VFPPC_18091 [Pochonia chlamydosporia 170]
MKMMPTLTLTNRLEPPPRPPPRQHHHIQRLNEFLILSMFAMQCPQGLATKCVGTTEQYPQRIRDPGRAVSQLGMQMRVSRQAVGLGPAYETEHDDGFMVMFALDAESTAWCGIRCC